MLSVRSAGGAVSDVPAEATAYAGRNANFAVVALGSQDATLDAAWAPVEKQAVGSYFSFESQLNARRLRLVFPSSERSWAMPGLASMPILAAATWPSCVVDDFLDNRPIVRQGRHHRARKLTGTGDWMTTA